MKPILYLHIGMHKTGTTSIQATFFTNRTFLLGHDVNYFALNENHTETVYPLFAQLPKNHHFNTERNISRGNKAARRNAKVEAALKRELANNRSSRFVISGEGLFRLDPPDLALLKQTLAPLVDGFRIIVYVREPYGFLASAFQQRLKGGNTVELLNAQPPLPRYSRVQAYIDAFGRDNVDIRVFDRARLVAGDLISDFLSALGLDPGLARKIELLDRNRSLSAEAAELLAAINARYPRHRHGQHSGRAYRPGQILQTVSGRPFRCPEAAIVAAQPRILAELDWLHKTLGETVFDPKPPRDHENAARWTEDSVNSVALLINDLARLGEPNFANLCRMIRIMAADRMRRLRPWR